MLTVKEIQALKAKLNQKRTRYPDSNGLYLYVTESGHKSWYFVYKFQGKKQEMFLGRYEDLTLAKARIERDDKQALVRKGENPKAVKVIGDLVGAKTQMPTLKERIELFCATKLNNKSWTQKTYDKNLCRFGNHLIPELGELPVNKLTKADIVRVFSTMTQSGLADTAHRLRQMLKKILRRAATEDLIDLNLVRDIEDALYDGEVLEKRPKSKSFPALTQKNEIAKFFKDSLGYGGQFLTVKLMELSANLFMRPSEIRTLKWSAVDFEQSQLVVEIKKGDFTRDHLVPLSTQSKQILLDVFALTGNQENVFYSAVSKYMTLSENTVGAAIKRMGYNKKMTAHGFRAMVTTTIREQLKEYRNDVIEVQLSHTLPSQTRRAYDRAEYLDERRQMMQSWSDYLYGLIE